jgi:pimeloyl-ACP methyl ester carboxylesterase
VKATESRALLACSQFRGDALVVESGRDPIVPPQVVTNYKDALSGAASLTYRLMPNADHALGSEADQQSYTEILVRWLSEMIRGARAEAMTEPVIAKPAKVEVAEPP